MLLLRHSAAGGCAAVRHAPAWGLIGQRVLRGGGKRGEVLVKVVLQVAEGILCLLVHALVQLLPLRLVFGKGFVRVVLCHLRVFCLTWLSLCLQCIASGFGEDAVRLDGSSPPARRIACACVRLQRAAFRGVCQPVFAILRIPQRRGEEQDVCLRVQQTLFHGVSPYCHLAPLIARVIGVPACFNCQCFHCISSFSSKAAEKAIGVTCGPYRLCFSSSAAAVGDAVTSPP